MQFARLLCGRVARKCSDLNESAGLSIGSIHSDKVWALPEMQVRHREIRRVMNLKRLYQHARFAISARRRYRSLFDIPRMFLLQASLERYKNVAAPISFPVSLRPKELTDPVYLRLGNSDVMVLEEIFSRAEYEPVRNWDIPPDSRIIDLGANIGLASLFFASLFPQSHLMAIEPDEANCLLMRRNCRRLIREGRVTIHRAFAAKEDGVAGLDSGLAGTSKARQSWAFSKSDKVDAQHVAVPCMSIPTLLRTSGYDEVDLLKCDIEGSERELFANCAGWIGKIRHLIVETHNSWSNPEDSYPVTLLYEDLRKAGWDFEVHYELQEKLVGIAFLKRKTPAT